MNNLQQLLDLLCTDGVHISITDIGGVLGEGELDIGWKYIIHSKEFCNIAKKTAAGYELCMRCKKVCNYRALRTKKAFSGLCPFGLFEAVYPVVCGGAVIGIVYVGGTVRNFSDSYAKLQKALYTGADGEALCRLLHEYETDLGAEKYFLIAEVVADYIIKFYTASKKSPKQYHRAVALAMHCADVNYYHPLALKSIAASCFVNEKYLGRIFKEQTGRTFHEYLNAVRLERAAQLLTVGDDSIIQVALSCGFNSPSYFNREFVKKYGVTPKKYRKNKNLP